ncbi:MAG: hypothetical protein PHG03_01950 [Bacilli bacterium]|nr:hypothetical protein [Bacilli bacterium]MDD4795307.1 hypothetical protein [Bacilli bacterium]
MFFAKKEIIELEDKNYLVLNSTVINNEVYYEVCEVNVEKDTLDENKIYIKAIKEFGSLYVEEVKDDNIITLLNEALEG